MFSEGSQTRPRRKGHQDIRLPIPPKQGSGAAPAGKDASRPEPQHWYKSREEAPKPPSTRPEAKKGTRWASRSKYLWPTATFKSDAQERDKPTVPAEAKVADWKSPKAQNEGEPKYPKASGGPKAPSREEHKYPKASGTTKAPDSEEPTDPQSVRHSGSVLGRAQGPQSAP
ncbi:hypothetical protein MRX96_051183 [Rhipicephalus microplus]